MGTQAERAFEIGEGDQRHRRGRATPASVVGVERDLLRRGLATAWLRSGDQRCRSGIGGDVLDRPGEVDLLPLRLRLRRVDRRAAANRDERGEQNRRQRSHAAIRHRPPPTRRARARRPTRTVPVQRWSTTTAQEFTVPKAHLDINHRRHPIRPATRRRAQRISNPCRWACSTCYSRCGSAVSGLRPRDAVPRQGKSSYTGT